MERFKTFKKVVFVRLSIISNPALLLLYKLAIVGDMAANLPLIIGLLGWIEGIGVLS